MTSIARRTLLASGFSLALAPIASPALAAPAQPWLTYERRLRGLLADPPGGDFDPDFEQTLADLNTLIRRREGAPPLAWDAGLAAAARAHAADMAVTEHFDHLTREGYSPAGRVGLLARDLVGAPAENIAMRRNADAAVRPDQIMNQWRDSPGHRANLVAPGFTHVGYGALRQGPRVIAVGAYAEVAARLAGPAPLSVRSPDEIARALSNAAPPIRQFSVSEPGGEVLTVTYVEGRPPSALPPGAWQLRPHLSSGEHRYQLAWGPVFVLA
ncbi:CAP domain-containing protein [Caulobacter segnis]|uniref:CAP domain-containing protein n=1 Tax=Caulobacter segnis TaxID=88688 RepID=A0A2W5UTD6_9CAUL|nr:CAP domain-containing protein [Caulobacter segnis]PZR30262.1 MAG: CAP domain-containing protein [Caulobacter segnis]